MALALNDRVKETTTVTGTGTATLLGATTGFQSFAVIGNANTTYYCIADQGGANWEVGIGTYTASGTTLARTTVLASSNAGALVVFTTGVKDVFVTYPSEKGVWLDASNNAIGLGTPAAFIGTNITGTATAFTASNVTTNANLTGAITSTGNTTSLGTSSFTSANLAAALTDETGTGANVFANSPTLVTPALGTPSSGTLTNCTFPTLNQNTTGSSASCSGNAATATTLTGDQTNWATYRASAVANMLGWKNYGNGHIIFDASSSTSPTGTVVNSTNAATVWSATYPTLMGWNGTGTYGVRVDSARIADNVTTNANLTGAITSTGNTTSLGTSSFTSANLAAALTDETGTGANVFANSPTLVTPILGTPTSGTLTSCTGLPLTTGVTGTLPIANGGTGLTSSPTVNVKTFGATGNGSTDDRAAIQAAIDSISVGTVIFPAGAYLINAGVVLKPNVSLVGDGTTVYLLAGANTINLLNYNNPSSTTLVSNFNIDGINLSANSKTGCNAIFINGNVSAARCSNININNLQINGVFANAIYLTYCANSFISNLFITSSVNGVSLLACTDTDIVDVKVQSGSGGGFVLTGSAGAFDEGTRLTSCSTNGQVIGLSITGQDWGIVTGCSFTTCSGGSVATAGACTNWKFTNCEFACGVTPNTGVALSSTSSKFSFTGCLLSNNTFGMALGGSLHVVSACIFDANTNVDLYLSSTSHVNATGNIFNSTGSAFSVLELTANYSNIAANQANGTITLVGAQSVQSNNILY